MPTVVTGSVSVKSKGLKEWKIKPITIGFEGKFKHLNHCLL